MKPSPVFRLLVVSLPLTLVSALAQGPKGATSLTSDQIIERASSSVALVLTGNSPSHLESVGSALTVRENGILLTTYHLVKDAQVVQVRFKNGETFDDVQLLGVDRRRDVAAIRIAAQGLPVLPLASANRTKAGESIWVVSNATPLPWTASTGIVSAFRMADEVPGAGSGYRLLQFTAPASTGGSGGVVLNARAEAVGLIVGSLEGGQNLNFAVPLESVAGLADAPPARTFASASAPETPSQQPAASADRAAPPPSVEPPRPVEPRPVYAYPETSPQGPELPRADLQAEDLAKSELLKSKDPDFILRNFRTLYVDASKAQFFGDAQMKAALGSNRDFAAMHISLVDDPTLADVVLEVSYTFAWDYPFSLRHQNTTMILLAGKGKGPFSGPAGATSVAKELAKALKPYRAAAPVSK
jgi:S1-C subfamily serine protease